MWRKVGHVEEGGACGGGWGMWRGVGHVEKGGVVAKWVWWKVEMYSALWSPVGVNVAVFYRLKLPDANIVWTLVLPHPLAFVPALAVQHLAPPVHE